MEESLGPLFLTALARFLATDVMGAVLDSFVGTGYSFVIKRTVFNGNVKNRL